MPTSFHLIPNQPDRYLAQKTIAPNHTYTFNGGKNIMDRFFKTCLVLIVLLLAVIALRLIVSPQSVHAQGQHKYVAVKAYGGNPSQANSIQAVLDKYAADGWELAAPIYVPADTNADVGTAMYLIFRK